MLKLPFEEKTYRVSEFASKLREALRSTTRPVWISGEVQRLRRSGRGHLYFELIEKGRGDDVLAKLEAVVWRSDLEDIEVRLAQVDQRLVEGVEIRCRAQADFYPPFGRLQLVVRSVDPEFTLGLMARRRRETLEALEKAGMLGRNGAIPLTEVPLRVALVTSRGSAAYHDFIATLAGSGYAFKVSFIHSSVQGVAAEGELIRALTTAGRLPVDCIVMIRGGGSQTDLAVFDSRSVSESIALARVPVITGLGHEIDDTVSDAVSHTRARTPTRAGELLVERLRVADQRIFELRTGLVAVSRSAVNAAQARVRDLGKDLLLGQRVVHQSQRRVEVAKHRLDVGVRSSTTKAARRQETLTLRLQAAAQGLLQKRKPRVEQLFLDAGRRSFEWLRREKQRLDGMKRLCVELSPARTLGRGFSITRAQGQALRSSGEVEKGTLIETELARGTILSRVEEA